MGFCAQVFFIKEVKKVILSTQEMKAKFWAMTESELREIIDQNAGYQAGIFTKLGNLPEKPFQSQLVDLAIACTRYDYRIETERAKMATRRRARSTARPAVA